MIDLQGHSRAEEDGLYHVTLTGWELWECASQWVEGVGGVNTATPAVFRPNYLQAAGDCTLKDPIFPNGILLEHNIFC